MSKQAKQEKRKSQKLFFLLLQQKKRKTPSPRPLKPHSTFFAVIKQIYVMGLLIQTFKHVFNFFQLNSPIDISVITHVNAVKNVFKDLGHWGQTQG